VRPAVDIAATVILVDLSVSSSERGSVTVVHVEGEIDVYTAPLLREVLDKQVAAGRTDLVVDLEKVTFMDSTGLGVLVGRLKLVRGQNGTLRIVSAQERILKVFKITGLDKVFHIYATVDEALAASNA
jgi:anti-sigma B factor antagonist